MKGRQGRTEDVEQNVRRQQIGFWWQGPTRHFPISTGGWEHPILFRSPEITVNSKSPVKHLWNKGTGKRCCWLSLLLGEVDKTSFMMFAGHITDIFMKNVSKIKTHVKVRNLRQRRTIMPHHWGLDARRQCCFEWRRTQWSVNDTTNSW